MYSDKKPCHEHQSNLSIHHKAGAGGGCRNNVGVWALVWLVSGTGRYSHFRTYQVISGFIL